MMGWKFPSVPCIYRDTIVCYSYSKSLSLPGERIGYVYVPGAAADSEQIYAAVLGAARAAGHVCAPSLMQQVIARCASVRRTWGAYDANRRPLYDGLTAMGYQAAKPGGGILPVREGPHGKRGRNFLTGPERWICCWSPAQASAVRAISEFAIASATIPSSAASPLPETD